MKNLFKLERNLSMCLKDRSVSGMVWLYCSSMVISNYYCMLVEGEGGFCGKICLDIGHTVYRYNVQSFTIESIFYEWHDLEMQ